MSLVKLNILEPMDISVGHQIIMTYGNGDYYAAFDRMMRDLDNYLNLMEHNASQEGFLDSVKETAQWIWNKIKELWDALVAFVRRIFGKNEVVNNPAVRNVINYGKFPDGYVPSLFENVSYTGGNGFFMPSVKSMETYLTRVQTICRLLTSGDFVSICHSVANGLDFQTENEESPVVRFRYFFNQHAQEFRDIANINFDIARIRRFFGKDDNIMYAGHLDEIYQPVRSASLYAEVNPYLEGGWTSGTVFKNMIGVNGQLPATKKIVADTIETFKHTCVDPFVKKSDRLKSGIRYNTEDVRDRFNCWVDQMNTVSAIVNMLLNRFTRELTNLEAKMKTNCDAINDDITKKFEK